MLAAVVEAAKAALSPNWSTELVDPGGLRVGMRVDFSVLFSFQVVIWSSTQAHGALWACHSMCVLGSPGIRFV